MVNDCCLGESNMDSFELLTVCKPFHLIEGELKAERADLRIDLNGSQSFLLQCPQER